MRPQCDGFAAKQIDTPQAVLQVANKREPRWPASIGYWWVVLLQDPANDILINTRAECPIDLLGDSRAAPGRIPLFHLDHGTNDVSIRPFRSGLGLRFGENTNRYFRWISAR